MDVLSYGYKFEFSSWMLEVGCWKLNVRFRSLKLEVSVGSWNFKVRVKSLKFEVGT